MTCHIWSLIIESLSSGSSRTGKSSAFKPAYLDFLSAGALAERARTAERHLEDCDLCARYCHVNRRKGIRGAFCSTGERARVHSFGPHHGEEDCLRGWAGSGTIFFSWCNLRCVFCQNWEISWQGRGEELSTEALAQIMVQLQEMGCHNINLVSPSHVVAQILGALVVAVRNGLRLPLVYNTGGHDSLEALALLDGVVDIYMPDMKYGDAEMARRYSHVRDHVRFNQAAVQEMYRQVGDLIIDADGVARRGLLARHLVLPNDIAGTDQVLGFLAREISPNTYVNLMDQYMPCYKAGAHPELDRAISAAEFEKALASVRRHGLTRLDPRSVRRRLAG